MNALPVTLNVHEPQEHRHAVPPDASSDDSGDFAGALTGALAGDQLAALAGRLGSTAGTTKQGARATTDTSEPQHGRVRVPASSAALLAAEGSELAGAASLATAPEGGESRHRGAAGSIATTRPEHAALPSTSPSAPRSAGPVAAPAERPVAARISAHLPRSANETTVPGAPRTAPGPGAASTAASGGPGSATPLVHVASGLSGESGRVGSGTPGAAPLPQHGDQGSVASGTQATPTEGPRSSTEHGGASGAGGGGEPPRPEPETAGQSPAAGVGFAVASPLNASSVPAGSHVQASSGVELPGVASQLLSVLQPLRTLPNGAQTLTIALHPEGLGDVKATMTLTDDALVVRLTPATPAGADALRQAMPELQSGLAQGSTSTTVVLADHNGQFAGQYTSQFSDGSPGGWSGAGGRPDGAGTAPPASAGAEGPVATVPSTGAGPGASGQLDVRV